MRIIVSGGGTGGHIYPAITLIRAIQEKEPAADFLYVGTRHGLEADIVQREGIPFREVNLLGFKRSLSLANVGRAAAALAGVVKAMAVVRAFRPDAAIGTGGYVCGPTLLAASLLGVPTLIQEQNVVPGITNRLLAKFVTRVAVGTPEAAAHFPAEKVIYTGNPIRRAVVDASRQAAIEAFRLEPTKKTVLVSGGSQGAKTINRAMIPVIKRCAERDETQILFVTGRGDYEDTLREIQAAGVDLRAAENIVVRPYLYDMPEAMAAADLAVFRAGAIGIAELTARGVPAILVPYPYAAANHQEKNARALAAAGAARMILDRELTGERLLAVLTELLHDDERLKRMGERSRFLGRPKAAEEIAAIVLGMTEGRKA